MLKVGARFDDTSIDPGNRLNLPDNDYRSLSGNVYANYHADRDTRLFGGVGKASRVPDARELYFYSAMVNEVGTPTLNDTQNYEIDLGVEKRFDRLRLTTGVFHSWLKDYIYYNADHGEQQRIRKYRRNNLRPECRRLIPAQRGCLG